LRYFPLEIEKYYELISPTFHLLRRTDGSKYSSNSIKTVRAAMLSEELFYKNDEGLYELNIPNAIKHVTAMKIKKERDDIILNERLNRKKAKRELKEKARFQRMLKKKKKIIKEELAAKEKKEKKVNSYGKFGNAYKLFNNLLKLTEENQTINSQINLDVNTFSVLQLEEDNHESNKVL